ncbi:MAG: deoxyribodipyrimidine photo-lyase [Candidatus Aenigmatarchaeota archaeon]|nr:DNA photolyase family protein [Candidatus Aenigmarchaeota archaeon]
MGLCAHIFRRDLRIEDNTSLIYCLKNYKKVLPIFILDKNILKLRDKTNSFSFMIDCLIDLNQNLNSKSSKLYLFYDYPENVIKKLIDIGVETISVNRDYTPYSKSRDEKIRQICIKNNVKFFQHPDLLLNEPEDVVKDDGKPYTIFFHFLRKSKKLKVKYPEKNNFQNYFNENIGEIEISFLNKFKGHTAIKGGRQNAIQLLKKSKYIKYKETRNFASKETTKLSPHNRFGTVSIREVYYTFKENGDEQLINELYWRDFFIHIGYHFPHVFKSSFKEKYRNIKWNDDKQKFKLWCEGKTGFPIVDAGMRELNQTGFMHNRVRMITSSFLVKVLGINWRLGERYFASKLIDYDPSVNNGNWQWIASTGCDSQPFFRVFNPWLQQRKFDPNCIYIKKWIPELFKYSSQQIHSIENNHLNDKNYPNPIVDYKDSVKKTLKIFKQNLP